jgi:hypothetical protein
VPQFQLPPCLWISRLRFQPRKVPSMTNG